MKNKFTYILCVIIVVLFMMDKNIYREKVIYHNEMLKAKKNTLKLYEEIYCEKLRRGIFIDEEIDLKKTGMIGEEFTGITTTLGDLESKKISTNPNFSSYFVKVLKKKGLKKGDLVAVNMSSSFPGMNISLISALDILELRAIIVNSIGSSMYGANNEEFTFLEMAYFLKEKGMIKNFINAYSLGGDSDLGKNFDDEIKRKIEKRIEKLDIKKFYNEDYKENLKERIEFFNDFGEIKFFFNIGGNLLHEQLEKYYTKKKIPVISMLNIKQKAAIQVIVEGKEELNLYYEKRTNIYHYIIIFSFLIGMIIIYILKKKRRN